MITKVVDERLDPDRLILIGVDVSLRPRFSGGEVTKVFFDKSPSWLRNHEMRGRLILDRHPLAVKRTLVGGHRYYCLDDVELISHALAQNHKISAAQLRQSLVIVKTIAEVYRYL